MTKINFSESGEQRLTDFEICQLKNVGNFYLRVTDNTIWVVGSYHNEWGSLSPTLFPLSRVNNYNPCNYKKEFVHLENVKISY